MKTIINVKAKIISKIKGEIDSASKFITVCPDQANYFLLKIERLNEIGKWLLDIKEDVVNNLNTKLTIDIAELVALRASEEGAIQALEDLQAWLGNLEV